MSLNGMDGYHQYLGFGFRRLVISNEPMFHTCSIQVGVATDTARRIRAEQAMAKYQDVEKLYDTM